ncbi:hypothetical protein ACPA9J_17730 [Pseudomonas aeruginosa]
MDVEPAETSATWPTAWYACSTTTATPSVPRIRELSNEQLLRGMRAMLKTPPVRRAHAHRATAEKAFLLYAMPRREPSPPPTPWPCATATCASRPIASKASLITANTRWWT